MKENNYSPCDYVMRATDNKPKPLEREMFESLLQDFGMEFNVQKVREHKPDSERYKRLLPAVTWQAHFDGHLRTDKDAIPSGLFCLDVDYQHSAHFADLCKAESPEAAWAWAEKHARTRAEAWAQMQREQDAGQDNGPDLNIVGIHVSPQGAGVHVIACCNEKCKSIAENQARLAQLLETEYDEVCKDWARIWFLCPQSDWTYLDMDALFQQEQ